MHGLPEINPRTPVNPRLRTAVADNVTSCAMRHACLTDAGCGPHVNRRAKVNASVQSRRQGRKYKSLMEYAQWSLLPAGDRASQNISWSALVTKVVSHARLRNSAIHEQDTDSVE
jgi:hypothetical protein